MTSLFHQLDEDEISMLISHAITYIQTNNLDYYDMETKSIQYASLMVEYSDRTDFKDMCTKLCDHLYDEVLYPDVLCRIILDFSKRFKHYMLNNVDFLILTVYDKPFISFSHIRGENNLTRSCVLEISHFRYHVLAYQQDKMYLDRCPTPNYFHGVYSKILLSKNKNLNI
jgi:hypothetical protein